jgi:Bifunctional DNA primase/polymerase, N-terminal
VPAVKNWQAFDATAVSRRYWFGSRRANVGLRTGDASGYVVVDTDTAEAEAWVRAHLPETPMAARSGNGSTHRYYGTPPRKDIRNKQTWKGISGLDVRGSGGYVVLPGSTHPLTGKLYEWLTDVRLANDLPAFSPRWVYERQSATKFHIADALRRTVADAMTPNGILLPEGQLLERARAYLQKIEPAVSGRNGHTKTLTTALKLARLVNRNADLLWLLLTEYSARCEPPWSEKELRHKWSEALRITGFA